MKLSLDEACDGVEQMILGAIDSGIFDNRGPETVKDILRVPFWYKRPIPVPFRTPSFEDISEAVEGYYSVVFKRPIRLVDTHRTAPQVEARSVCSYLCTTLGGLNTSNTAIYMDCDNRSVDRQIARYKSNEEIYRKHAERIKAALYDAHHKKFNPWRKQ